MPIMSHITLQPHSLTNPSDKYRVVRFDDWRAFADGELHHLPCVAEFTESAVADAHRDELNDADS